MSNTAKRDYLWIALFLIVFINGYCDRYHHCSDRDRRCGVHGIDRLYGRRFRNADRDADPAELFRTVACFSAGSDKDEQAGEIILLMETGAIRSMK